jgi:outer membrane protein assembly factor BamE (lipoprotein component of BamABCDE complex)
MLFSIPSLDSVFTRRHLVWVAVAALLAGCSPEINHRGYYPKAGALAQVSEGMAKSEVESILGSPSTTASINFQGDSYYYITSISQGRSFLEPIETSREVIAVRFDKQDQVSSVAQYGLEDGRIININSRKTPAAGQEFSLLKELFRSGAKFGPKAPGLVGAGKQ